MGEQATRRPDRATWERITSDPGWADRVLHAVQAEMRTSPPRTARVRSVGLDRGGSAPLLTIVYEYAPFEGRRGLARSLRVPPPVGAPHADPAAWMADWIVGMEVDVPIGRLYGLLSPDEHGIRWWGEGYPDFGDLPPRPGGPQRREV